MTEVSDAPDATDAPGRAGHPAREPTEPVGRTGADPAWAPVATCLAVIAVLVPIVVAVVRAIADDWLPVGDNAFFNLRARDVLTEHNPQLGTWTSASLTVGTDVNNPGPLWFDVLALPSRVDEANGIAVGVALVNGACVVGIALLAHRLGGARLAVASMLAAGGLAWAMGSELLFDPWQPHSLLFPFLLTIVLAWAAAAGDPATLPWLAFTGSLLVQTHVSYVYVVPVLVLCGVVGLVRARRRDPSLGRPLRRSTLLAVAVGAVCWIQPLVEQFAGDGKGNLSRLIEGSGEGEAVGIKMAPRLLAAIIALPTWWSRRTFEETFTEEPLKPWNDPRAGLAGVPTGAMAVAGLAILAALLVGLVVLARRRGDRVGLAAVAVSVAAVAGGVLTTATMPIGILGITPHQLRWLWPISVFVTFTIVAVLSRLVARPVAIGVPLAAVIVLAAAATPKAAPAGGPAQSSFAIPLMHEVFDQLREADLEGPVVFDPGIDRFAEPYTATVQDQLDRLGVEFRVDDEGMLRQVGDSRAVQGDERMVITLREGAEALEPLEGGERIAFATTLGGGDLEELERLEAQLVAVVDRKGVALSELGRGRLEMGNLFPPIDGDDGYVDPGVVSGGGLAGLFVEGFVEIDPEDLDLVRRWTELRLARDHETIAVYALPVDGA